MTMTLLPFDDKHRLDHRSLRNRQGSPYYGHALRRVIEQESPVSKWDTWYAHNEWWLSVVIGGIGAAMVGVTGAIIATEIGAWLVS